MKAGWLRRKFSKRIFHSTQSKGDETQRMQNSMVQAKTENGFRIFENPSFGQIRTQMKNGEPWFAAPDVCKALEINNSRMAADRLDPDEKMTVSLTDSHFEQRGGAQKMTLVNEPGLYSLVLGSRKPEAKEFKRWITHEVIPTIRKTGGYVANEDAFLQTYLPYADENTKALFRVTLATINDQNRKIAQQQEKIALDAPKVHFANSVESSQTSILIGTMAKLLKQNGVNTGEKRLFQQLRHDGFLCDKGKRHNVPTQKSMEMGLFDMTERTFSSPSGETKISVTTKVTGKGQTYFLNRYAGKAVTAL